MSKFFNLSSFQERNSKDLFSGNVETLKNLAPSEIGRITDLEKDLNLTLKCTTPHEDVVGILQKFEEGMMAYIEARTRKIEKRNDGYYFPTDFLMEANHEADSLLDDEVLRDMKDKRDILRRMLLSHVHCILDDELYAAVEAEAASAGNLDKFLWSTAKKTILKRLHFADGMYQMYCHVFLIKRNDKQTLINWLDQWTQLWSNLARAAEFRSHAEQGITFSEGAKARFATRQMSSHEIQAVSSMLDSDRQLSDLTVSELRETVMTMDTRMLDRVFYRHHIKAIYDKMPVLASEVVRKTPGSTDLKKRKMRGDTQRGDTQESAADQATPRPPRKIVKRDQAHPSKERVKRRVEGQYIGKLINFDSPNSPHCDLCRGYPDSNREANHDGNECRRYKRWRELYKDKPKCKTCGQRGHDTGSKWCPQQ